MKTNNRPRVRVVADVFVDRDTGEQKGRIQYDENGNASGDHPSQFPRLLEQLQVFRAELRSGFKEKYEVVREERKAN